ncbi:hypothetical protein EXIGLDRAFT_829382 [Exidia glandulosa HHB12029]|uniref:Uncharacterized protein n=1 Tax=Exidia glandulosa HHB12029 TaxID=1314781 RepID=A0A165PQ84_EXIGL|nr:hypothetical protein EXIGLDRAFT_829382 [Exidia glandulosa HHB12029]
MRFTTLAAFTLAAVAVSALPAPQLQEKRQLASLPPLDGSETTSVPPIDTPDIDIPPTDEGYPADEAGDIPVDDGTIPVEDGTLPEDDGTIPVDDGEIPVDDGEVPVDDGEVPVDDGEVPVNDGDLPPIDDGEVPVDDGDVPVDGGDVPVDGGDVPVDGGDVPVDGEVPALPTEASIWFERAEDIAAASDAPNSVGAFLTANGLLFDYTSGVATEKKTPEAYTLTSLYTESPEDQLVGLSFQGKTCRKRAQVYLDCTDLDVSLPQFIMRAMYRAETARWELLGGSASFSTLATQDADVLQLAADTRHTAGWTAWAEDPSMTLE